MQNNKKPNDNNSNNINRNTSYYKSRVNAGSKPKKSNSDFMDMAKKRQMNSYRRAMFVLFVLMLAFTGLIWLGTCLHSLVDSTEPTNEGYKPGNNQTPTLDPADIILPDPTDAPPDDSFDVSEIFSKYNGVYLDVEKLESLDDLQYFIDNIKSKGINAVNIDIKKPDGTVPYHINGQTDSVVGIDKYISIPIEDIIKLLHDSELYVSGTIVCFKDNLASMYFLDYTLYDSSVLSSKWQDGDGSHWLNPYNPGNYIQSIVEDSAKLGFDEIILSWFFFPNAVTSVSYGDYDESKYAVVKDFVTAQRHMLNDIAPKVKLGLEIPLAYFLSMPNEAMGINPSELIGICNFFATSFAPAHVPTNQKINGEIISNPESSSLETVTALCEHFGYLIKSPGVYFRPYLQAFGNISEDQISYQKQALDECGVIMRQLVNYENHY